MTDRAAAPRPGYARCPGGASAAYMSCRAVTGRHEDRGLPQRAPGLSRCTCAASAACPLPLLKRPGLTVCGFIYRRFRPRITAGYICGKRSAYLCVIAAWRVDSFAFFSVHKAWIALSQVKALLRARPGNTIPSISPMCAQARRRFTQVIHMVMHSKACNTFSCRLAGSVAGLARGGRHPGRGSGLGLDDIAPDGEHRMLGAHLQDRRPRVPRCLPAVTLIVILPAARPRYAQAARARRRRRWPPPARTATSRAGGAGPLLSCSVADHRPTTADAEALAPGGVSARDGAAPSLRGSRDYRLRLGAATREPRPARPDPRS